MKPFALLFGLTLVLGLTLMGFRGCRFEKPPLELFPDMDRQMYVQPQTQSPFFGNSRADRPDVAQREPFLTTLQETYPHLRPSRYFRENAYLQTGKNGPGDTDFGTGIPIELTAVHMAEGQELYTVFCAVCHGASGNGNGVLKAPRYGYATIASLLQSRLIEQPDGEIYNTIAWGKNTMMPYGGRIVPEDRWKIVLYVRALQRASRATPDDVPAEARGGLGL